MNQLDSAVLPADLGENFWCQHHIVYAHADDDFDTLGEVGFKLQMGITLARGTREPFQGWNFNVHTHTHTLSGSSSYLTNFIINFITIKNRRSLGAGGWVASTEALMKLVRVVTAPHCQRGRSQNHHSFLCWHIIKYVTYSVLDDVDFRCLLSESSRALLVSSPGLPTCPDCAWYGLGWMVRGALTSKHDIFYWSWILQNSLELLITDDQCRLQR